MNLFVIIVTYNGENWLGRCIGNTLLSTVPVTIIVVDNGSSDNTVLQIEEHFPQVTLIETKQNLGFAKANNIGIKKALENNADFVFLLNQDAWFLSNNVLEELVKIGKNNPEYGIVSPVHLNGTGTGLDKNFALYVKSRNFNTELQQQCTNDTMIHEVDFVNAAAWLLSKECLIKVGGFDTHTFKHYGEDVNYVQRLHFAKLKIGVVANCYISHDREFRTADAAKEVNMRWIGFLNAITDVNLSYKERSRLYRKLQKVQISYLIKQIRSGSFKEAFSIIRYLYKMSNFFNKKSAGSVTSNQAEDL